MNVKKALKTITAMVCCVGCLFSNSADIYGMETEKIEVTQEIKDGITAYMETENGEIQPLDCDISLVKHTWNTRTEGDMYTLEVKSSETKSSSDSIAQAGIALPSQIAFAKYDVGYSNSTKHSITMDLTNQSSFYYTDPCHNQGRKFFLYMYARTKEDTAVRLTVKTSMFD